MKKLLLGIILLSFSSAYAEFNLERYNGDYSPIIKKCGLHVEISNTTLITTAIKNKFYTSKCRQLGLTEIFECNASTGLCEDTGSENKILLLTDGNLVFLNRMDPDNYVNYKNFKH